MIVFPQDEGKETDTRVVMIIDAICRGIGKKQQEKKHCSLASVILANIYRSLRLCKNGSPFYKVATFYYSGGSLNIYAKEMAPNNKSWPIRSR